MEEQKNEAQTSDVSGEITKIVFRNFTDAAQTKVKNDHVYFVKTEYVKKHPNYETLNSLELFKNTDIQNFFHNPNGPAVLDLKHDLKSYFIDGQMILDDSEEMKKIKHNEMFNNQMDQLLSDK